MDNVFFVGNSSEDAEQLHQFHLQKNSFNEKINIRKSKLSNMEKFTPKPTKKINSVTKEIEDLETQLFMIKIQEQTLLEEVREKLEEIHLCTDGSEFVKFDREKHAIGVFQNSQDDTFILAFGTEFDNE